MTLQKFLFGTGCFLIFAAVITTLHGIMRWIFNVFESENIWKAFWNNPLSANFIEFAIALGIGGLCLYASDEINSKKSGK